MSFCRSLFGGVHEYGNILVEVHAQESPASVTAASSTSSTSHVSFIPQASDDAVDSCTAVSVDTVQLSLLLDFVN